MADGRLAVRQILHEYVCALLDRLVDRAREGDQVPEIEQDLHVLDGMGRKHEIRVVESVDAGIQNRDPDAFAGDSHCLHGIGPDGGDALVEEQGVEVRAPAVVLTVKADDGI